MLKKLIRYDLKYLFRYWWIVALATLPISVVGGLAFSTIRESSGDATVFQTIAAALGMMGTTVTMSALMILPTVLNAVRFYKNLYSDEGYLTFTLPVERREILKAKLISAMILQASTIILLLVDGSILASFAGLSIDPIVAVLTEFKTIYLLLIAEVLILILEAGLFSILLVYACISFGAMITKKYKVLAAVGIYYAVGSVISGVGQFFYFTGIAMASGVIFGSEQNGEIVAAIILIPMITLLGAAVMGLFTLVHWQMDRKLNLS